MVNNFLKPGLLACGLASMAAFSAEDAKAATFDLAFLMDESGSIAQADYLAAMGALADALEASLAGNPNDTYNVSVIPFGSSASVAASATIAPNSTVAQIQAALTDDIRADTFANAGATCFSCAFAELGTSGGDFGIINMMTDGQPNFGVSDTPGLLAIRDGLRNNDGWDSLSFEAVAGASTGLLADLAFDTAGTGLQPVIQNVGDINDPLNDAFVLEVASFGTAYATAISEKVARIVEPDPIPLPAGLPLILAGLGALGALRLRSRKTA